MSTIDQTAQEIIVPTSLPMILKNFCKAAIRTQPYDLLKWSSSYFRALADGEEPPTKFRLEYPPPSTASGLTLGFLRVLLRQFGDYNKLLPVETILRRWDCLCLDRKDLNLIMMIGKFRRKCQVKKFLAIAVGLLGSSLFETMIMICELFTHEPDGGSAMIPVTLFMEIYGYLAGLRCDGSERESSDEDPMEFLVCDESENIEMSLSNEQQSEGNKSFIERICSIASQDTEADVNLDLELVSKEDVDSVRTDVTQQTTDSCSVQKEVNNDNLSSTQSEDVTLKTENGHENSVDEIKDEKTVDVKDEQSSDKISHNLDKRSSTDSVPNEESCRLQEIRSTQSVDSKEERKTKMISDSKLITHYPNIPGIGPRLSAEEVASVAIWMNECARLQDGMVGPRNLRHMNCPPLDRQRTSDS